MSDHDRDEVHAEEKLDPRKLVAEVGRSVVSAALARAQAAGSGHFESEEKFTAAQKANILVEALPYIRKFAGTIAVIKYGGSVAASGDDQSGSVASLASFVEDVSLLRAVGIKPVVVHGGGPQIGELMARLGKESVFKDGLRVTDKETLEIAQMVLVGKINLDIVQAININGPIAIGLSGADAGLIRAEARAEELGFVGEIVSVDPNIINKLLHEEIIPVIATIGSDSQGQAYNINADSVAGAVAEVLGATKLIYLTDVPGILMDAEDLFSLVRSLDTRQLASMISDGSLRGGMIPKAASCLKAVRSGVGSAHILDGRVPHALLLEVFTDQGTGTMVTM
jgi:acetylglutamate kinase